MKTSFEVCFNNILSGVFTFFAQNFYRCAFIAQCLFCCSYFFVVYFDVARKFYYFAQKYYRDYIIIVIKFIIQYMNAINFFRSLTLQLLQSFRVLKFKKMI